MEDPKTAMPSNVNTSNPTATTLLKICLQKEKNVKVQEQKEDKKKEKVSKGKTNIREIPSDGESSSELEIVEPDAEMEFEAGSPPANVEPTAVEGETGE